MPDSDKSLWRFVDALTQDARYGFRILRRTPGFVVTAVFTLGVGLGLNSTLFTLFNAYVLRPVSVRDPYSLYELGWTTSRSSKSKFSWEQYKTVSQARVFSDAIAAESLPARVEGRNLRLEETPPSLAARS